jgi:hypothetical protein
MPFERRTNVGPSIRLQQPEVFHGFGGKNDLETHSGQIIARPEDRQTWVARMSRRLSYEYDMVVESLEQGGLLEPWPRPAVSPRSSPPMWWAIRV